RAVLCDEVAGVDHLAVDLASQRGLGQTTTDRSRHFGDRDRAGEFALGAVGERDVQHGESRKQKSAARAALVWVRRESGRRELQALQGQGSALLSSRCHNQIAFLAL